MLGILAVAGAAIGFIVAANAAEPDPVAAGSDEAGRSQQASGQDPSDSPVIVDGGTAPVAPIVTFELEDYKFSATGVLPERDLAEAISQSVATTFDGYGSVEILIDPSQEVEPWMEQLPFIISNFTRLFDGTLVIDDGEATFSGRSPDAASVQFMVDALSTENGFTSVSVDDLVVVAGEAPIIAAVESDQVLFLSGVLPSGELRTAIIDDARQLYGERNVVDSFRIDRNTYARFNLIRFTDTIEIFRKGGPFELMLKDGSLSGRWETEIAFATESSETPESASVLLAGLARTLGDARLEIAIEALNTEAGDPAVDDPLAQARAQSIETLLVELGVDRTLLETEVVAPEAGTEVGTQELVIKITAPGS